MKINEIGEFNLIDRIMTDTLVRKDKGLVGIGDDCAMFKTTDNMSTLITTDMLVESVHFSNDYITPYQLGYKAMAVNLSDIAACGGIPREALISISIPKHTSVEYLEELYRGMKDLAREYDVNIIGGDTTRTPMLIVINVVVIGEVDEKQVLLRSGAKENDLICVTGYVGDSAAGMDILFHHRDQAENYPSLMKQQHTPHPHVKQGRIIAESGLANAMIDVSDGVIADLKHICDSSGVGAEVFEDKLRLSDEFMKYCGQYKLDILKTALGWGEDYCLLLTVAESGFAELQSKLESDGFQLFDIGRIIKGDGIRLFDRDGNQVDYEWSGWDHFG